MQNVLGKRVEMVEYADSMDEFVANIFRPAEIDHIQKKNSDSQIDVFLKRRNDLGIAIGKGGCNIEKGRILLKRFFGADLCEVLVEGAQE